MNYIFGHAHEVKLLYGHSLASWTLISAYVLLGLTGLRFAFRRDGVSYPQGRQYWFLVSLILFFLALNRYTDLLLGLTAYFREMAEIKGLYAFRRPVQLLFVTELVILGVMLFRRLRRTGHLNHRTGLTLFGLTLLVSELLVKTISYHYLDRIINTPVAFWTMNGVIEALGILSIAIAFISSVLRRTKSYSTTPGLSLSKIK